jgi:hypothetical protein
MEKEPAQQTPQQEQATATPAIAATGQDNMPILPPPPFTITSSGPGGVERSGADTLSPTIKPQGMAPPPFKIEASTHTKGELDQPGYAAANAVLGELSTSGASLETARQDDRDAVAGGPEVSARMAKTDQQRVMKFITAFLEVGAETGLPPALLAAIASRESRGGKHLDANGYGLSDPDGYGVMQVDVGSHQVADQDGPGGLVHIRQAAGVLASMLEQVKKKFPDWSPAMQLRGAVAAYNFGPKSVQTWDGLDVGSAHGDYSADIWERARHYASLPEFGGDGVVVAAAKANTPQGRPALRKGRLIAEPVGAGGVNHPEDVARVLARLRTLKVITSAEEADHSTAAVTAYVTRYQALVNENAPDGLMEPGRKTEDRLIAGTLTRGTKTKTERQDKRKTTLKQEKTGLEDKALAEYRRILKETPATEAGAEAILAHGDTFAANAFADLVRMGRFDLLHALKAEVWAFDRDWMARSIAQRLSDAELAALPKEFLAELHTALDAGVTSSDEYVLMDKLGKAMGDEPVSKGGMTRKQSGSGKDFTPMETFVSKDDWRTQSPSPNPENQKWEDSESGWENCKYVAEKMVYRHLYKDLSDDFLRIEVINSPDNHAYIVGSTGEHEYLSVQREDKSKVSKIAKGQRMTSLLEEASSAEAAIGYLSAYLAKGIPVVVGVDHTYNRSLSKSEGKTSSRNTYGYNEGTTDHFVTIVGEGIDSQGKRYFQFFDPGTQDPDLGTSNANRLVEEEPMIFRADQPWKKDDAAIQYTLSMVVLFRKDIGTFQEYVDQNEKDLDDLKEDFSKMRDDFSYRKEQK